MQTLQLNTRLSNKSWVSYEFPHPFLGLTHVFNQLGDDSDEEDPFAEVGHVYIP